MPTQAMLSQSMQHRSHPHHRCHKHARNAQADHTQGHTHCPDRLEKTFERLVFYKYSIWTSRQTDEQIEWQLKILNLLNMHVTQINCLRCFGILGSWKKSPLKPLSFILRQRIAYYFFTIFDIIGRSTEDGVHIIQIHIIHSRISFFTLVAARHNYTLGDKTLNFPTWLLFFSKIVSRLTVWWAEFR